METANADEALAAVSGGAVDIALIDFNMPGIDGLELVAGIRKTHPDMPLAVVSANVQNEIIGARQGTECGIYPKAPDGRGPCRISFRRRASPEEAGAMTGCRRAHRNRTGCARRNRQHGR